MALNIGDPETEQLARLLAERTGEIAADYAARRDPGDGGGLRQMAAFTAGLHGIQVEPIFVMQEG